MGQELRQPASHPDSEASFPVSLLPRLLGTTWKRNTDRMRKEQTFLSARKSLRRSQAPKSPCLLTITQKTQKPKKSKTKTKTRKIQRDYGRNEKDQKISTMILTNNKTPKIVLCIIKEEIRLKCPIINLLKTHTHTYINFI